MEIEEYQDAYYQVKDEVVDSLPIDLDEQAFGEPES